MQIRWFLKQFWHNIQSVWHRKTKHVLINRRLSEKFFFDDFKEEIRAQYSNPVKSLDLPFCVLVIDDNKLFYVSKFYSDEDTAQEDLMNYLRKHANMPVSGTIIRCPERQKPMLEAARQMLKVQKLGFIQLPQETVKVPVKIKTKRKRRKK